MPSPQKQDFPKCEGGVDVADLLDEDEPGLATIDDSVAKSLGDITTGNKRLDELMNMDNFPSTREEMAALSDEQKDAIRVQLTELTQELVGQLSSVTQEMQKIKGVIHGKNGLSALTKEVEKMQSKSQGVLGGAAPEADLDKRVARLAELRAQRQAQKSEADDGLDHSYLERRKKWFSFEWFIETFILIFLVFILLLTFSPFFREATIQLYKFYVHGIPMDPDKLGAPTKEEL